MWANEFITEKFHFKQSRVYKEKDFMMKSLKQLHLYKENSLAQSQISQTQKKAPKIKSPQELKERLVNKETEKIKQSNLKSLLKNELMENTLYWQSFLNKHKIDKEMRTKMIDWMIEVLSSFSCEPNTFFVSINIMDSFLQNTKKIYQSKDIHLIGVTSMLIASKIEEILPFKISTVSEKMTHNKISPQSIQQMEFEILMTLDFNLLKNKSILISVEFLFVKLNFYWMDKYEQIWKIFIYLSKMISHDYDLIKKYSLKYLAASIVFITVKILEQIKSNLNIDLLMEKLKRFMVLDEDIFYESSEEILGLAKNFERRFPNAKNLQKYDYFQIEKIK